MKYIVPEYYKSFLCKGGDCRSSCCDRWPVRISMREYFYLLGEQCSDQLRARLDCALKVCPSPSKESYGLIASDYRGICMLHQEDGLCAIQKEFGAAGLPEVCRLYPRSTKKYPGWCECSCSNSCEAVIELLMKCEEPLRYEESELEINPIFIMDKNDHRYECRMESIAILQDRNMTLPQRLSTLGNYLNGTTSTSAKCDRLSFALQIMNRFLHYYEDNASIGEYCLASRLYYKMEDKGTLSPEDNDCVHNRYLTAVETLTTLLPDWQILFEQFIVNHMFYNSFPYVNDEVDFSEAYLALVATVCFLRFNLLSYMSDKSDVDSLVDYLAAMFRVIEHSDFRNVAVNLVKQGSYPISESIMSMIYL